MGCDFSWGGDLHDLFPVHAGRDVGLNVFDFEFGVWHGEPA